MIRIQLLIFYLWMVIGYSSCKDNNKKVLLAKSDDAISVQIKDLEKVGANPTNRDSLITVWRKLDRNPIVKNDTIQSSTVKYQLARLYSMLGNDSSRVLIESALELIDPTDGNFKSKALIYNGMGNVLSMGARMKEASYYYNKAAAIVLADSTVDLSFIAKTSMLLSAAQSNLLSFQYDLAEKMNRAALPMADSLPQGHINQQRVLVQMIQTLNKRQRPADSMAFYLQKLEVLHAQNPNKYNISFLYDSKIQYFEKHKQLDSLLHYQLLKIKSDGYLYNEEATSSEINNLFIDYCNIAAIYTAQKYATLASQFLEKAKLLKEKHTALIFADSDLVYQQSLASLYNLQGKKNEAIAVLTRTAELQKGIYQTENTQAVAEMNALHQLQTKDRSIHKLNEGIKINKLQLQQNRLWLAVSVLGIILLGVTVLFLFYSFRQRRYLQEKEKILLQQQLLRTQMEPHFIFNTLAAVQSFVRLDKKEIAIKYLNRFSRLLRSSLELSRENLVPLDEEIETLENYLSLQQMRYENAFRYTILQSSEHDLGAIMVPPMLIQPYVENAILHGIDLEEGLGDISIHFEIEQDILQVKIADSGKTEKSNFDPAHRSLSGTISHERIQLLGKKASVSITEIPEGGGTLVILRIPVE